MERIIVIIVSAGIGIAGIVFILRLLLMKINGEEKTAEVVRADKIFRNSNGTDFYYVHTVRFEHNGKMVEKKDKTGYSQPFDAGETVDIIVNRKNPDSFEYKSALKKNLIITAVLTIMAGLMILRFAFGVTE